MFLSEKLQLSVFANLPNMNCLNKKIYLYILSKKHLDHIIAKQTIQTGSGTGDLIIHCLCFQFVLAAVLAVAAAAPAPDRSYGAPTYAPKVYQILKQEAELRDDQSYDSQ